MFASRLDKEKLQHIEVRSYVPWRRVSVECFLCEAWAPYWAYCSWKGKCRRSCSALFIGSTMYTSSGTCNPFKYVLYCSIRHMTVAAGECMDGSSIHCILYLYIYMIISYVLPLWSSASTGELWTALSKSILNEIYWFSLITEFFREFLLKFQ